MGRLMASKRRTSDRLLGDRVPDCTSNNVEFQRSAAHSVAAATAAIRNVIMAS